MSLYSRASAGRSLVDTIAGRAVSQLATVLGYLVLVRALAKDEFGAYSLLNAFIPVFSTVASLGLEQVLRRYQPEYLNAGRRAAAAWLVRVVSAGRLATNLVLLGVVLLAWNHIAPTFKLEPYRQVFLGFAVLMLLQFQVRILQLALSSHMLHRYSVGSAAVLSLVKLALYSALYLTDSLNLSSAIIVDTVALALAYGVLQIAYRRHARKSGGPGGGAVSPDERRRMFRYGLLNNFNDAGSLLMYSTLDSFFIASFASVVAVGIYGFFTRLNEMSANILPVRLFDNVVQPMLFATRRDEASQRIPRYFTFLLNMNLAVQLPMLAFVLGYHHELVQLLSGGKYVEDSWLLPLLMGFATINAVSDAAGMVALYEERAGILLLSKLFVVYNIVAMAVLVPMLGICGAALASGSAQTMKDGFIWWNVRRHAVWTNAPAALVTSLPLWGGVVALCIGLKSLVSAPGLVHMAIGCLIIGAAALLHLRGPALASADRQLLESVVPKRGATALQWMGLSERKV